jgi:hypothetical protein
MCVGRVGSVGGTLIVNECIWCDPGRDQECWNTKRKVNRALACHISPRNCQIALTEHLDE